MASDLNTDLALAGGAVALTLIDTLTRAGIIDQGTGLAILASAQKRCAAISQPGAAKVIGDLYSQMSKGG